MEGPRHVIERNTGSASTQTEVTPHGWRATARTLLAERLGFKSEVIEHLLAHKVSDSLGAAYNRTQFLDERTRMLQTWAADLVQTKPEEPAEGRGETKMKVQHPWRGRIRDDLGEILAGITACRDSSNRNGGRFSKCNCSN